MSKHICSCVFIIYIQSPLQNRSITLSNTKGANLAHFTYLDEPLSGKVNAFWDTETVSGRFNHEIRRDRLALKSFRTQIDKLQPMSQIWPS